MPFGGSLVLLYILPSDCRHGNRFACKGFSNSIEGDPKLPEILSNYLLKKYVNIGNIRMVLFHPYEEV